MTLERGLSEVRNPNPNELVCEYRQNTLYNYMEIPS